jgi:hypothetical protein
MSRRKWIPLTWFHRIWLTAYVLIWPVALLVAVDWYFGPTSQVTSVTFLIACLWSWLRYRLHVKKHIRRVTLPRRRKARR